LRGDKNLIAGLALRLDGLNSKPGKRFVYHNWRRPFVQAIENAQPVRKSGFFKRIL